jgi:hypothetical protein
MCEQEWIDLFEVGLREEERLVAEGAATLRRTRRDRAEAYADAAYLAARGVTVDESYGYVEVKDAHGNKGGDTFNPRLGFWAERAALYAALRQIGVSLPSTPRPVPVEDRIGAAGAVTR